MSGPRHRPSRPIACLVVLAVLLAGCRADVPDLVTPGPSATRPAATPIQSDPPFKATSYPVSDKAPCGEDGPPDATHAAYRGQLKRIEAVDRLTVVFELCRPDVGFLAKIAAPAFGIQDSGWLRSHLDPTVAGVQAIVTEPNGSGPYRLEGWVPGAEISLARDETYHGSAASNERVIVRWIEDANRRVDELQAGTVDGIDDVQPSGVTTVENDVALRSEPRPGVDSFYLGFDNTVEPYDNEKVRRAIAIGIDRRTLVERYFPPGSAVATHFGPCALPFACAGDPWAASDPTLAKEMLAGAGYGDGFDTRIHVAASSGASLPDLSGLALDLKGQLLDNLGIRAEVIVEPADTYLADVEAGKLDGVHLLGRTSTYPDVSAFLDPRFGVGASKEFGKTYNDIAKALGGGHEPGRAKREAAYAKANDLIRQHAPLVPIARSASSTGFRLDVAGAAASPLRLERFAGMIPADRRQFVWLTSSEPAGLYCPDETDPVAGLVCAQVVEGLYGYDPAGASVVPALADVCSPNGELTVWTCALRDGVRFADGSGFDAADVVLSFAVQWDADHPLHLGRTGTFATFRSWFGGFLNPPAPPAG